MKFDSIAIMYLIVMFLVALSFSKALEIVVDWAIRVFGNKKLDVIDLPTELNALSTRVDACGNELDAVKTVVNAITAKLESIEKLKEQHSLAPALGAAGMPEDTWQRSEHLQHEVITMVPTIEQSASADSWTRDAGVYAVSKPGFRSTRSLPSVSTQAK